MEAPLIRKLVQLAPRYTKMGAFSLTSFPTCMVLDESTCFIDPVTLFLKAVGALGERLTHILAMSGLEFELPA